MPIIYFFIHLETRWRMVSTSTGFTRKSTAPRSLARVTISENLIAEMTMIRQFSMFFKSFHSRIRSSPFAPGKMISITNRSTDRAWMASSAAMMSLQATAPYCMRRSVNVTRSRSTGSGIKTTAYGAFFSGKVLPSIYLIGSEVCQLFAHPSELLFVQA